MAQLNDEVEELDRLSNLVNDLTKRGRLEEAEEVCKELRLRYPSQIDWIDRSAQIFEAKGEKKKAAEYYRKAACFAQTSDGFAEETIAWYEEQANVLDPR